MTQERIQISRSSREWEALEEAACRIRAGEVVGQFVRAVCVLWIDAENRQAAERIYQIKGEQRLGRPFSIILETRSFISILDEDRIHPSLHPIFFDPEELEARLGAMCMVRAPIREEAARRLPDYAYSRTPDGAYRLQSWVPNGHAAGRQILEEMWALGVRLPGATSMNVSGQPEIVDQDEAACFCEEHDIGLFLNDPLDPRVVRGSFPILSVDEQGAHVVRQGHYPAYLFKYLLDGAEIDLSEARPSKYPILETHTEEEARRLPPHRLREDVLRILDGG